MKKKIKCWYPNINSKYTFFIDLTKCLFSTEHIFYLFEERFIGFFRFRGKIVIPLHPFKEFFLLLVEFLGGPYVHMHQQVPTAPALETANPLPSEPEYLP